MRYVKLIYAGVWRMLAARCFRSGGGMVHAVLRKLSVTGAVSDEALAAAEQQLAELFQIGGLRLCDPVVTALLVVDCACRACQQPTDVHYGQLGGQEAHRPVWAAITSLETRQLNLLLLCIWKGLPLETAAQAMRLSDQDAQTLLVQASKAAIPLWDALLGDGRPVLLDEGLRRVARELRTVLRRLERETPPAKEGIKKAHTLKAATRSLPKQAKAAKCRWGQAVLAFVAADLCILATAAGIYGWSAAFIREQTMLAQSVQPFEQTIAPQPFAQQANSLFAFYYLLPPPDPTYKRISHLRSETVAQEHYQNEAGHFVTFTQQVSAPVTGFDARAGAFDTGTIQGYPAAFRTGPGMSEVFWYNGGFCYTLSTDLPLDQATALAAQARIGHGPATSLETPLDCLPEIYPPKLALSCGNVVVLEGESMNVDQLRTFYQAYLDGTEASVRLSVYTAGAQPGILDLETAQGTVYITGDFRRVRDSARRWEQGEAYEALLFEEQDGMLCLYTKSFGFETWELLQRIPL